MIICLKYSIKRRKKLRKKSAVRIDPGMASSRIASGRTGFAHALSTARSFCTCFKLLTNRSYSSSKRSLLSVLILLMWSLSSVKFFSHLSKSLKIVGNYKYFAGFDLLFAYCDRHGFDADVVNVVGFIKYDA